MKATFCAACHACDLTQPCGRHRIPESSRFQASIRSIMQPQLSLYTLMIPQSILTSLRAYDLVMASIHPDGSCFDASKVSRKLLSRHAGDTGSETVWSPVPA